MGAFGVGQDENIIASDVTPLLQYTRDIIYFEDGEYAVVTKDNVELFDRDDKPVVREPKRAEYGTVAVFEDLYGNRWDLVELAAGHPLASR